MVFMKNICILKLYLLTFRTNLFGIKAHNNVLQPTGAIETGYSFKQNKKVF